MNYVLWGLEVSWCTELCHAREFRVQYVNVGDILQKLAKIRPPDCNFRRRYHGYIDSALFLIANRSLHLYIVQAVVHSFVVSFLLI